MYAVELLTGPSLGVLKVINWSKFVFYQNIVCQKHYKIGDSAHFLLKNIARAISKVINWSKLAFLLDPQLGPINNFDLDQSTTLKNGIFVFCFQ